jgi:hypothetical protein
MAYVNFEKGDFVTWINKPGCFGIYEGKNLNDNSLYTKKMTLLAFFDPSKYTDTEEGYKTIPFLDVSKDKHVCEKTMDTEKEDYWWHKATKEQKENAMNILAEWGYYWDEENLALVKIDTGEIIKRIIIPKLEYNGEVVKPICDSFKDKLVDFVKLKNKPTTTTYNYGHQNYPYWCRGEESMYDGYYDD